MVDEMVVGASPSAAVVLAVVRWEGGVTEVCLSLEKGKGRTSRVRSRLSREDETFPVENEETLDSPMKTRGRLNSRKSRPLLNFQPFDFLLLLLLSLRILRSHLLHLILQLPLHRLHLNSLLPSRTCEWTRSSSTVIPSTSASEPTASSPSSKQQASVTSSSSSVAVGSRGRWRSW